MLLCAIADVSRKCYYDHRARRVLQDRDLIRIVALIRTIQQKSYYAVGYRHMTSRIRRELGLEVNEKRVLAIMRSYGLLSVVRRKKFAPEIYVRRRELQASIPENLLKGRFFSCLPGKIFVTDITYLFCLEEVLYLNSIVDLFNREVVAWTIGEHPDSRLCIGTLAVLGGTHDLHGAIMHSDRGSGYVSWEYRDLIEQLGAVQSCTKTGRCWDNASMESFNGVLKTECLYNRFGKSRFNSRRIRKADVVEAVTNFIPYYNGVRLKRDLGWLSPIEYREANPRGTLPIPMDIDRSWKGARMSARTD
jgi:transposase InsO family protein